MRMQEIKVTSAGAVRIDEEMAGDPVPVGQLRHEREHEDGRSESNQAVVAKERPASTQQVAPAVNAYETAEDEYHEVGDSHEPYQADGEGKRADAKCSGSLPHPDAETHRKRNEKESVGVA